MVQPAMNTYFKLLYILYYERPIYMHMLSWFARAIRPSICCHSSLQSSKRAPAADSLRLHIKAAAS